MKIIYIILCLCICFTVVSRYAVLSAYFDAHKQITLSMKTADWKQPTLYINKESDERSILISEQIYNGQFNESLNTWTVLGDVEVQGITPIANSIATQAAVIHSSSIHNSGIKKTLASHDELYLQFYLNIISTEEIHTFTDDVFQVVVDESVIYTSTGDNSNSWQDINVVLPATSETSELKFVVNHVSTVVQPVSIFITDITTNSVLLSAEESISFSSNEPNTNLCFFEIYETEPYQCELLPYEQSYSINERKHLQLQLTDSANLKTTSILSIERSTTAPTRLTITNAYLEENNDLSIQIDTDVPISNQVNLELGTSEASDGLFTWRTISYDWKDAMQTNNIVDQNHLWVVKLIKNVDQAQSWIKVRSKDKFGNYSQESVPYQIN